MISKAQQTEVLLALDQSHLSGALLRRRAMELLSGLSGYNWSGVYRLEADGLHLDEFVGTATDHMQIPVGRGVCGTAVAEDRNQVIEDVRSLDNYLACSTQTRSEIVVLIREAEGAILGQIDIDGHEVGAFNVSDERLLEEVAKILASRWA